MKILDGKYCYALLVKEEKYSEKLNRLIASNGKSDFIIKSTTLSIINLS
jgi:hypothetical protein